MKRPKLYLGWLIPLVVILVIVILQNYQTSEYLTQPTQPATTQASQAPPMILNNVGILASGGGGSTASATDINDCINQCYGSSACGGVVYDPVKKTCTLKNNPLTHLTYDPHMQSAVFAGHVSGLGFL